MQGSLDALFIRSSGLNDKTDLWEVHSGQEAQPANSFIRLTVVQMVERNTIGFAKLPLKHKNRKERKVSGFFLLRTSIT